MEPLQIFKREQLEFEISLLASQLQRRVRVPTDAHFAPTQTRHQRVLSLQRGKEAAASNTTNIARCLYFAHRWHRRAQRGTRKHEKAQKGAEEHNEVQWSMEKYKEVQKTVSLLWTWFLLCSGVQARFVWKRMHFSTGTVKDGQRMWERGKEDGE